MKAFKHKHHSNKNVSDNIEEDKLLLASAITGGAQIGGHQFHTFLCVANYCLGVVSYSTSTLVGATFVRPIVGKTL